MILLLLLFFLFVHVKVQKQELLIDRSRLCANRWRDCTLNYSTDAEMMQI